MNNPFYLLANKEKQVFTQLHTYDPKRKMFLGEYSLLHNQYAQDSRFLSQFLVENVKEPLYLISSKSEEYHSITNHYTRFLEQDIPKYMEEKTHKQVEEQRDHEMDKNLGQLQIALAKKMVEGQLETIQNQSGKSTAEHQILLGKELALQWTLHMMEDIVQKGSL